MKTKSLQFGKAMSAALFVLLLSVVGMKNLLAQNQVATLQHEGNITVFYGASAFANANEAASIGDTITLSSGNFTGCELTKAITINGAGCVEDTIAGVAPTIITSGVTITVNNDAISLTIEGIRFNNYVQLPRYFTCNNLVFKKCFLNQLNSFYGSFINLQIINCIVQQLHYDGSSTTIINSVIHVSSYGQNNQNDVNIIYNSVLVCEGYIHLNNSTINNSIIATSQSNSVSNTVFHNCIGIKLGETSLFEGQLNSTNMEVDSYEDVFETFTGTVSFRNIYQLKEEIATTFLGNDGTEVGIYGGMAPYHTRPNYMIIKNCNVAGRTTEDNKLNVEIELLNAGE